MTEPSAPIRASVVIPNWNGLAHLPDCLDALQAQTFRGFETIVVDNGSTDASLDYLAGRSAVRVVTLGENTGFPGAVNAGIAASEAEYVVLLNNDTAAEPSWLAELVGALDASPEYSWASSKLVAFDDPDVVDSAGHRYSLWVGAAFNIGEGDRAELFTQPRTIFGATAAASIYRRSLFEDIGGFDDEFFFIHEDTEFDLRANVAGHQCLFVPSAVIRHKRGASYEISAQIHLTGVRNRIWTTRNLPPGLLVLWVVTKALRAFRWIPARLFGKKTSARTTSSAWRDVPPSAVVRATVSAFVSLPRKRREVKAVRRRSSRQLLRTF